MIKRIFIAITVVVLAVFMGLVGYAESDARPLICEASSEEQGGEEASDLGTSVASDVLSEVSGDVGDNAFERAVDLAWLYKGDIGGVSAAVAAVVLSLVIMLKYVPLIRRYVNFTGAAALQTKRELTDVLKAELERYSSALAAAESVAELYPEFAALTQKAIEQSEELKALVTDMGGRLASNEKRHAAALRLQGETFKDMISLSALPASKKFEILENYRVIELEGEADAAEGAVSGEGDKK